MLRILLLVSLICLIEIHAIRRRCINSGVLFPEKTVLSPIVVYGESISKRLYHDSNTQLLYNITFRVDCILKGQDIENQIQITEAGVKSGHMACQWLDPGHFYVVFLEKWGTDINSYRPVDFQEHLMDNTTYELLARACHLTRVLPLHSTTNNCPNVSWIGYCPHDEIDRNNIPKGRYSDQANPFVKSSYFNDGNQFYLQSNVTIPKGGSIESPIRSHLSNYGYSLKTTSIFLISILLILIL